jgi:hypothetical protein
VYLGQGPGESHAFVQVLDGVAGEATFHRFPIEAFQADRDRFEISIGPNLFGINSIHLDIDRPSQILKGTVHFDRLTPWPSTFFSPGIMGWYSWMPFMECYHGVVSLDHTLRGTLKIDDRDIVWERGRGYIEKDWGRSFPSAWIWMQTNHFTQPGISLTASVAIIPWLGSSFRGMIVGLWHRGHLYRFATYTEATTESLTVDGKVVEWIIRDQICKLEIRAKRATGGILRGPTVQDMGIRVPETLNSVVQIRLTSLRGESEQLILEDTGRHAGLEVVGDIDLLLS